MLLDEDAIWGIVEREQPGHQGKQVCLPDLGDSELKK
jgi:hypothetical protein